ncbi:MAG TPA: hypothetical protein PKK10_04850 [Woeseiaceae bacterium]|nr:hypothetical protein [Woeseiaceae bacterium]
MAWLRFILYFLLISAIFYVFAWLGVTFPGSLKMQVFDSAAGALGTSEYSPVEMVQALVVALCCLLMGWVALEYPGQRPLAFLFGGVAVVYLIRELGFFLDLYVVRNLWQVLIAVAVSLVIAYTYRHRLRLKIALARIWPSPAMVLMFSGAVILFSVVRVVADESLWQSLMGENYRRVVKVTVEELVELLGFLFWLAGSVEYAFQAHVLGTREPQPAAVRRRDTRLGRRS